jgi:hypothetical protein
MTEPWHQPLPLFNSVDATFTLLACPDLPQVEQLADGKAEGLFAAVLQNSFSSIIHFSCSQNNYHQVLS